jgi:extradiol dioxygenase family protein
MSHDIENPMTIDSHWRHLEQEPQVIGECAGCEEDITADQQWLDMELNGHQCLVHQDSECCYQFVSSISICRGGDYE